MIVTCEQCATQFQLADSKIPAGGARVRCSRCKHAFFIEPAGAVPPQDPIARAVHDALDREAPAMPEATGDLSDAGSGDGPDFASEDDVADESDWEFSETPFAGDAPAASERADVSDPAREAIDDLLGSSPAARSEASAASEPSPFAALDDDDELGNPESWDLLAGSPAAAASPASAESAGESERAKATAPARPLQTAGASFARPSVEEWIEPTEPSRLLAWLARSGHVVGWGVTASLFALVAFATLGPGFASDAEPEFGVQRLAQLEAQGIAGRWVENLTAGPLFVVSGRLVNPTAQPLPLGALAGVRLLDASGARLAGEPAAIGPVIESRELRESDPAALRARQLLGGRNLAMTSLAPGQSIAFEAVVLDLPVAASRFVLEPIPQGRSATPPAGEPAPAQ